MRHLKEGNGWRLGYDPDATVFKGLVGGDRWAVEMTDSEFNDFCRLARQLAKTIGEVAAELMPEERLSVEQETAELWMEAEGMPRQFSLRFILLAGRQAEGGWSATVTQEILQALPSLSLF
ncbi:MAG: DUF1818 family protein [Leptolyngbyaceae cyanobacterium]